MKKVLSILLSIVLILGVSLMATSCSKHKQDESRKEDKNYDLSLPTLGKDGWYLVFEDDFDGDALNQNIKFGDNYKGNKEIWTTSPHAIRWQSNNEKSHSRHAIGVLLWLRLKIQI